MVCSSLDRLAPQSHAAMETFCLWAKKGSTLKLGWEDFGGTTFIEHCRVAKNSTSYALHLHSLQRPLNKDLSPAMDPLPRS
jgi:hypothetical protein